MPPSESERRYQALFDAVDDGFCILEVIFDCEGKPVDFRHLEANPAYMKHTGLVDPKGKLARELAPGPEARWIERYAEVVRTGRPARFREFTAGMGRHYDVYAFPVGRPEERQIGVLFRDVTEWKRVEEALKASEESLRRKVEEMETVLEAVPAGVLIAHDPEGYLLTGNRTANEILRLPARKDASLTASQAVETPHRIVKDGRTVPDHAMPLQRAARGETVAGFESRIEFPDGSFRDLVGNATPLFDSEGRPRGAVGAFIDITDRKRMEEALRATVAGKDDLLRELSHRTKNNMQVIGSLLELQATRSGDARLAEAMAEARDRIRAMALVHEKLYKSRNVSFLDMADYVKELVISLLRAHQGSRRSIKPVLDLEEFSLSLDAAVPCGLIINELVSNSLKHAFGEKKGGNVYLTLRRGEEEVELRYRDDGPGLPANLELFQVESLGLKLVHKLAVHQLRGTMVLRHAPVMEFLFRFRDFDAMNRLRA